jgi:hypothetical protein
VVDDDGCGHEGAREWVHEKGFRTVCTVVCVHVSWARVDGRPISQCNPQVNPSAPLWLSHTQPSRGILPEPSPLPLTTSTQPLTLTAFLAKTHARCQPGREGCS